MLARSPPEFKQHIQHQSRKSRFYVAISMVLILALPSIIAFWTSSRVVAGAAHLPADVLHRIFLIVAVAAMLLLVYQSVIERWYMQALLKEQESVPEYAHVRSIIAELSRKASLKQPPPFLVHENAHPHAWSPGVLMGLFGPHIIAPKNFITEFSDRQKELFLAHEIGHIVNGDTRLGMLNALGHGILTMYLYVFVIALMCTFAFALMGYGTQSQSALFLIPAFASYMALIAHGMSTLAFMRAREYLADVSGTQILGPDSRKEFIVELIRAESKSRPGSSLASVLVDDARVPELAQTHPHMLNRAQALGLVVMIHEEDVWILD